MAEKTYHMSYVLCPKCGDAIGGRMPQPPEQLKLTCQNRNCRQSFTFNQDEVCSGLVSHDDVTDRWQVARLADEKSLAAERRIAVDKANHDEQRGKNDFTDTYAPYVD